MKWEFEQDPKKKKRLANLGKKKKILTPRRFELLHHTIVENPCLNRRRKVAFLESTALDQLGHSANLRVSNLAGFPSQESLVITENVRNGHTINTFWIMLV